MRKKRSILIISILLVISFSAGAFLYLRSNKDPVYEFTTVKRQDLVETVGVTGRVEAAISVDLAFEIGGRVEAVSVDVGAAVNIGQELVRLNASEFFAELQRREAVVKGALADLDRYRAALAVAEAKLAELKKGTRPEGITVQEVTVSNARVSLTDATKSLINSLRDAYTRSEDAVHIKTDQIFSNPRTKNPRIIFYLADSTLQSELESRRVQVEDMLIEWRVFIDQFEGMMDVATAIATTETNLLSVKTFLEKAALVVSTVTATTNYSQSTIDGWRSDISTGRTNVNAAITNAASADEKLKSAQSALTLEENELVLKKAGPTPEAIAGKEAEVREAIANVVSQEAKIEQTRSDVETTRVEIAKRTLRAPIKGVVTKKDIKVGEIVAAQKIILSMISESEYEVKANIPEADIAKIALGDIAHVTLDAYSDREQFEARIIKIDPAETIVEGVSTYGITLQFTQRSDLIRSGMTANMDIVTDERKEVLVVPIKSVIVKNGTRKVRMVKGEQIVKVLVMTGLRGADGNIEIISGLNEGDVIVSFMK